MTTQTIATPSVEERLAALESSFNAFIAEQREWRNQFIAEQREWRNQFIAEQREYRDEQRQQRREDNERQNRIENRIGRVEDNLTKVFFTLVGLMGTIIVGGVIIRVFG